MEVDNLDQLLNYIYNDKDFSSNPGVGEYNKITRIMNIMLNFYKRGSESKQVQYENQLENYEKLVNDESIIKLQLSALEKYSDEHPKKVSYLKSLSNEIEDLQRAKNNLVKDVNHWKQLYNWSLKIVEVMNWLSDQLQEYSNESFKTNFECKKDGTVLSAEQFRTYKRGLEEVTYNLQESLDFFEASLDGRLQKFHLIEKKIVEEQIDIVNGSLEPSARKNYILSELKEDLEYVTENMKENPSVTNRREHMKSMHEDFFALLKWQRNRMLNYYCENPEKLVGPDAEALLEELRLKKNESLDKAMNYKLVPTDTMDSVDDGMIKSKNILGDSSFVPNGCPMNTGSCSTNTGSCPVKNESFLIKNKSCPSNNESPNSNEPAERLASLKLSEPSTSCADFDRQQNSRDNDLQIHRLYEQ